MFVFSGLQQRIRIIRAPKWFNKNDSLGKYDCSYLMCGKCPMRDFSIDFLTSHQIDHEYLDKSSYFYCAGLANRLLNEENGKNGFLHRIPVNGNGGRHRRCIARALESKGKHIELYHISKDDGFINYAP